jgi:serine/threonine protein kinase/Tfp pilus assembly protein PilF
MSDETDAWRTDLPLDVLHLIDQACDRFEAALRAGSRPRVEDYLGSVPPEYREALLRELLAAERDARGGASREFGEGRGRRPGPTTVGRDPTAEDRPGGESVEAMPGAVGMARASDTTGPTGRPQSRIDAPAGKPDDGLSRGATVRYFGDYEIRRELGRGGMGVVYEARQASLNRPVALKLVRVGLLAGDDELRRFRNEAEAVALLDHPGILPIYEVGQHDGQHYFSMKLVPGGSLVPLLDRYRDDPRAAAGLVAEAAEAVAHAHARGILHRDLKPANILIDAEGHPHITDFGLAKKVESNVEITQSGAILGTPAYMSPEQASGQRGSITTGTDVYGLGALLYALLTGRAPFVGDSVLDTLDAVRKTPPEPPSRRNATVPRDLETICLKCLEKDPPRRYGSAQALADDLRAWLARRPIAARRVGPAERAWLWCRRRPAIAALSAATTLAIVGGIAGIIAVQARANSRLLSTNALLDKQRLRAEDREAQAIAAVQRFRDAIVNEPALKDDPALGDLRRRLLKEPLAFFRSLRDQLQADGDTRPESLARLSDAGLTLGMLADEIGDKQDALEAFRGSMALRQRLADAGPAVAHFQRALAATHNNIGALLHETGRTAEAVEEHAKALTIRRKLADAHPDDDDIQRELADSHNNIAILLRGTGRTAEALQAHRDALAIRRGLADAHPDVTDFGRELAVSYNNMGAALKAAGRTAEALEEHAKALAIRRKLADAHPDVTNLQSDLADSHNNIGVLLRGTGRTDRALEELKSALEIRRKLADAHPAVTRFQSDLAASHCDIGMLLREIGRPVEAFKVYGEALAIQQKLADAHPDVTNRQSDLAANYGNIGMLLREVGRPHEALEAYGKALAIQRKLADANPTVPEFRRHLALSHANIGLLLRDSGRPAEALEAYAKALAIRRKLVDAHPTALEFRRDLANCHDSIGIVLGSTDRLAEALEAFEEALPILERLAQEHPESPDFASDLGGTLSNVAMVDLKTGRFEQARVRLRRAIERQRKALAANPGNPQYRQFLANHLTNLIQAAQGLGRDAEAAEAQRALDELKASDPQIVALDARLAAVLKGQAPGSNTERLALAQRAYDRALFAAAARLWGEALDAETKLADDRRHQHPYNAACAAALAAAGKGKDDPPPDDAAKLKLRSRALGWLKGELAAWAKLLEAGPPQARAAIAQTPQHWKEDTDLAGVRDAAALSKLPEAERKEWQALWADVDRLLKRAAAP